MATLFLETTNNKMMEDSRSISSFGHCSAGTTGEKVVSRDSSCGVFKQKELTCEGSYLRNRRAFQVFHMMGSLAGGLVSIQHALPELPALGRLGGGFLPLGSTAYWILIVTGLALTVHFLLERTIIGRMALGLIIVLCFTSLFNTTPSALADEPSDGVSAPAPSGQSSINGLLFYSPGCPHCHKLITEHLPVILEQFSPELQITFVNTANPRGNALFEAAMEQYHVPKQRRGVPILIVGEAVLISNDEIIPNFAKVVEYFRVAGGVGLPDIQGLEEALARVAAAPEAPDASVEKLGESNEGDVSFMTTRAETAAVQAKPISLIAKLSHDPVGNTLALLVLVGLILSVGRFVKSVCSNGMSLPKRLERRAIPLFSLLGLGVSAYLAYNKLTYAPTLCGPIGNCNAVQYSPYSVFMGDIPVALVGVAGYVAIISIWFVTRYGSGRLRDVASFLLIVMVVVGTVFSIYLTFLEPFVIAATCLWCLVSATVMAVLLWMTMDSARTGERARSCDCANSGASPKTPSRDIGEGPPANRQRGNPAQ